LELSNESDQHKKKGGFKVEQGKQLAHIEPQSYFVKLFSLGISKHIKCPYPLISQIPFSPNVDYYIPSQ
jgi:hypothetical protein